MSVQLYVGRKLAFQSATKGSHHAELQLITSNQYNKGNLVLSMNAWPCINPTPSNLGCHNRLIQFSKGRTITLTVTGDVGAYALDHDKPAKATGTITYNNGTVTYS